MDDHRLWLKLLMIFLLMYRPKSSLESTIDQTAIHLLVAFTYKSTRTFPPFLRFECVSAIFFDFRIWTEKI